METQNKEKEVKLEKSLLEVLLESDVDVDSNDNDDEMPSADEMAAVIKSIGKEELRQHIYKIADMHSFLGTVADASQVLTVMLVIDTLALSKSDSFDDYKTNKILMVEELSSDGGFEDIADASQALYNNIKSKSVVMPYMIKPEGIMGVIKDVSIRATQVANTIKSAINAKKSASEG